MANWRALRVTAATLLSAATWSPTRAAVRMAMPQDFEPVAWIRYDGYQDFDSSELTRLFELRSGILDDLSMTGGRVVSEMGAPQDFESWWRDHPYPRGRVMLSLLPIYRGDDIKRLADYSCGGAIEIPGTMLIQGLLFRTDEGQDERALHGSCEKGFGVQLESSLREAGVPARRVPKPFICRQSDRRPISFTVLGDSHSRAFDLAAMRVDNAMEVVSTHGATLRGMNNFKSWSGAALLFDDVMRRRTRDYSSSRDVLVINLGDVDVNGLSWEEVYLWLLRGLVNPGGFAKHTRTAL